MPIHTLTIVFVSQKPSNIFTFEQWETTTTTIDAVSDDVTATEIVITAGIETEIGTGDEDVHAPDQGADRATVITAGNADATEMIDPACPTVPLN